MKIQQITSEMAWAILSYNASIKNSFKSVTGIEYELRITEDTIFYKGGERNNGQEEEIAKEDFIAAFETIRLSTSSINTNTIRSLISNKIRRKITPLIGLLYSNNIIK